MEHLEEGPTKLEGQSHLKVGMTSCKVKDQSLVCSKCSEKLRKYILNIHGKKRDTPVLSWITVGIYTAHTTAVSAGDAPNFFFIWTYDEYCRLFDQL